MVNINTLLLACLFSGITATLLTVILVFLVVIYNNTKGKEEKKEDDDELISFPYASYPESGGGGSGGRTITLGDLVRMSMAAQAAKEKDSPKADTGGGQYL